MRVGLHEGVLDRLVGVGAVAQVGPDPAEPLRVDLTILDGAHRGEVVTVTAHGLEGDPLDLLGTPGTLTVSGGEPSVRFEP